jgi:hypothetical protein
MLMRAGLNSNPFYPTSTTGPMRMLAVVGADNLWRIYWYFLVNVEESISVQNYHGSLYSEVFRASYFS